MKKFIAVVLAAVLAMSVFSACGGNTAAEDTQPTEPEQPKVEDDGIMKILLIGHSLGNDSSYMFPDVYRNEGNENLIMGVLYHSGCRMVQHELSHLDGNLFVDNVTPIRRKMIARKLQAIAQGSVQTRYKSKR